MSCPMCNGEPALLGTLGDLTHLRCRACGWTYSENLADETPTADADNGRDLGDDQLRLITIIHRNRDFNDPATNARLAGMKLPAYFSEDVDDIDEARATVLAAESIRVCGLTAQYKLMLGNIEFARISPNGRLWEPSDDLSKRPVEIILG